MARLAVTGEVDCVKGGYTFAKRIKSAQFGAMTKFFLKYEEGGLCHAK